MNHNGTAVERGKAIAHSGQYRGHEEPLPFDIPGIPHQPSRQPATRAPRTRQTATAQSTPHDADDGIPLPPEPPPDDHYDAETAISYRMDRLRIDREARRRLDAEERPPLAAPPVRDLDVLLAEPDAETHYVVDQLAPANGRVMLSAQFKAGKTTLVCNLIRCLADNVPFLDRFEIARPPKRIVVIDTELDDNMLRRWLRRQDITNTAAVVDVIGLRGRVASFDPTDEHSRNYWTNRLRNLGCDYLILDCLRPVLDALGLDENHDAGRFLVPFDALLADAGISDALVVQHMGHAGERARGDSRLQDWPDAIWRIVRESDELDSTHFFSAYGRDVDVREGQLQLVGDNDHLVYRDGSRKDLKRTNQADKRTANADYRADEALTCVIKLLVGQPDGVNQSQIFDALEAHEPDKIGRRLAQKALNKGIEDGRLRARVGDRGAKIYTLANPCQVCRNPVTAPELSTHRECSPKP